MVERPLDLAMPPRKARQRASAALRKPQSDDDEGFQLSHHDLVQESDFELDAAPEPRRKASKPKAKRKKTKAKKKDDFSKVKGRRGALSAIQQCVVRRPLRWRGLTRARRCPTDVLCDVSYPFAHAIARADVV